MTSVLNGFQASFFSFWYIAGATSDRRFSSCLARLMWRTTELHVPSGGWGRRHQCVTHFEPHIKVEKQWTCLCSWHHSSELALLIQQSPVSQVAPPSIVHKSKTKGTEEVCETIPGCVWLPGELTRLWFLLFSRLFPPGSSKVFSDFDGEAEIRETCLFWSWSCGTSSQASDGSDHPHSSPHLFR